MFVVLIDDECIPFFIPVYEIHIDDFCIDCFFVGKKATRKIPTKNISMKSIFKIFKSKLYTKHL